MGSEDKLVEFWDSREIVAFVANKQWFIRAVRIKAPVPILAVTFYKVPARCLRFDESAMLKSTIGSMWAFASYAPMLTQWIRSFGFNINRLRTFGEIVVHRGGQLVGLSAKHYK